MGRVVKRETMPDIEVRRRIGELVCGCRPSDLARSIDPLVVPALTRDYQKTQRPRGKRELAFAHRRVGRLRQQWRRRLTNAL